ncbi:glycoside hydrolase superfamily, partial [Microdochium trichocladiopsis]
MKPYAGLLAPAATALFAFCTLCSAQSSIGNNRTHFPTYFHPEKLSESRCPAPCGDVGPTSFSWPRIFSIAELDKCDGTVVFEAMVRFPIESPDRQTVLKACTASTADMRLDSAGYGEPALSGADVVESNVDIDVGWNSRAAFSPQSATQVADAALKLQSQVARDPNNRLRATFAKSSKSVVGLYVGGEIHRSSTISLIGDFVDRIKRGEAAGTRQVTQICGPTGTRSSAHVFGIVSDTEGDLTAVHDMIRGWADGECVTGLHESFVLGNQTLSLVSAVPLTAESTVGGVSNSSASSNSSIATSRHHRRFHDDDFECKYTIIEPNDLCGAIASRCNIPVKKLVEWNGGDDKICNNLIPKEPICCSLGKKPDLRPQPQENGDCAVYEIQPEDGCWLIADRFHLTQEEIHKLNVGKTWGWSGCGRLFRDQKICVSTGNPPMPTQIEDVTCGPQVKGTVRPADGTAMTDLNPCPLNVCCSGWGYCGLTEEFCIDTSIDDTPGTARPNTNGCLSNCGKIEITNNDRPPATFIRVGYFEGWNGERPCLTMDATDISDTITHIHFAFGDISENYVPSIAPDVLDQWQKFLTITGKKKIISFGGWAFSNEPGTSHIIRQGVKPANRQTLANNIIKFVLDNDLDGVDFDWEYPGAYDIDGSDMGTAEDGANYLKFLTLVRNGLPKSSLAIAAPASYWYLRHFLIAETAKVLDYIVYMTYDFHGQWDVGNKWTSPGCDNGDCLRSHVNITETMDALAMITRAGVPANKVLVGITSYGRSFKMADPNCSSPSCKYLGTRLDSPAKKGKCTNTGGYLANGEIDAIKSGSAPFRELYDGGSDSDILIYDGVEYVGYMTDKTKQRRINLYKSLNFGGATDWAVDL